MGKFTGLGTYLSALAKSTVKAHSRKLPSGKTVLVREHRRKGDKHEKPAAGYDPVADYQQNGTRSHAFKAWFGDWEHDPENASKVVDQETGEPAETYNIPGTGSKVRGKDGKPVVVYHGTARGGFDVFDKAKLNPDSLYGPGFYFTEDEDVANSYRDKDAESPALLRNGSEVTSLTKRDVGKIGTLMRNVFYEEVRRNAAAASERYYWNRLVTAWNKASDSGDTEDLIEILKDRDPGSMAGYSSVICDRLGIEVLRPESETKAVYLNIKAPFDLDAPPQDDEFDRIADAIEALVKQTDEADERPDFEWSFGESNAAEIIREIRDNSDRLTQKLEEWLSDLGDHDALYCNGEPVAPRHAAQILQAAGYDGMTHIGGHRLGYGHDHRVWIAFEPTQIKAVQNAGTFDPNEESIYKGLSPGRRFLFATKRPANRRGVVVLEKGVVQKKATTRRTKSGETVQVKAHVEQRKDAKPKYGFEKPDPTKRPKGAKLEEMSLRTSRSVWDYDQSDSRRYGGHVFVRRDRKKSIMLDDDQLKQMENGEAVKWGFKGTANGTFQADWSRYHERIAKEKKQAEWESGREQREAEARAERDKLRRAICAEATGRSLEEYLREFTKPSNNPYGYSREWIVLNHRAKVFEAARAGYDVPQARFDEYPDIMKKPRSEAGRKKAVATLMADAGVPKREVAQVLSDRKLPDTENMAEAAQAMVHFWEFSRERKSIGTWCHADDGSRLLVRNLEPIRKRRVTRPTEPSESEREEAPKQTMSLFSSLRMALERAVARNG